MSDKVEQHPNIFEYATKELSQDAVICWLLAWAQPSKKCLDEGMHEAGQIFLQSLLDLFKEEFEKKEKDPVPALASLKSIDIKQQDEHTDVTAALGFESDEKYCLLIEDKTGTSENPDAMKKYIQAIAKKYEIKENRVLPVYFKTYLQGDLRKVREIGYKYYGLKDFLCDLRKGAKKIGNRNLIYSQCLEHFNSIEEKYKRDPKSNPYYWWDEWIGLFDEIQKKLQGKPKEDLKRTWLWGITYNPSGMYPILWGENNNPSKLYVQLDKGVGTVRMFSESKTEIQEKRKEIWDALLKKLDDDIPVTRGGREKDFKYRSGNTCKVFEFRYLILEDGNSYVVKSKDTSNDTDKDKYTDKYKNKDKHLNEERAIPKTFTIDVSKTMERMLAVSDVLPEVEEEVFNQDTN